MKNILITGGTSGVGYASAKQLITDDTHLIIVGRNEAKGAHAVRTLGDANVSFIAADLGTNQGITYLADVVKQRFTKLDGVILAAGAVTNDVRENRQINFRTHYDLVMALKPMLTRSRILLVTGNPKAIQLLPINEQQNSPIARAGWVLTHKTLLMIYLSELLRDEQIIVNSFFPGEVQSNLMPYTQTLANTEVPVVKYLMNDSDLAHVTGTFFDDKGNKVVLNSNKYNFERAKAIVTNVIQ